MSEIKFKCETCGQPILVDAQAEGRTIQCPSCHSTLVIRAAAEAPAKTGRARVKPVLDKPASPRRKPAASTPSVRLATREPQEPPVPAPTPATASAASAPPEGVAEAPPAATPASAEEPAVVQIAALTPETKLEIVEAVRARLADPTRWMPGVTAQGKFAYAARKDGGAWVPVEVGDAHATHHSLMGAILLELHLRNVAATATGRTEFLDHEVPNMIREVAPEAESAAEPTAGVPGASVLGLMGISHAQCLTVLERLAQRYERVGRGEDSAALRQLRGFTVEELVSRVTKDEPVTGPEIVRAVHLELTELRHRLEALEKARGPS